MSPTSYQTAPPRGGNIEDTSHREAMRPGRRTPSAGTSEPRAKRRRPGPDAGGLLSARDRAGAEVDPAVLLLMGLQGLDESVRVGFSSRGGAPGSLPVDDGPEVPQHSVCRTLRLDLVDFGLALLSSVLRHRRRGGRLALDPVHESHHAPPAPWEPAWAGLPEKPRLSRRTRLGGTPRIPAAPRASRSGLVGGGVGAHLAPRAGRAGRAAGSGPGGACACRRCPCRAVRRRGGAAEQVLRLGRRVLGGCDLVLVSREVPCLQICFGLGEVLGGLCQQVTGFGDVGGGGLCRR